MRVYKTRIFARFARKAGLADRVLLKAVADIERGLIDADLGGGLFKQRIARPGQGKSGSFRTILVYRKETIVFFVRGYAKNEVDNIRDDELMTLRKFASTVLKFGDKEIQQLLVSGAIAEVKNDE